MVSARLREYPPPTAIFACNDMMATGARSALLQAGLRIPEDVSLIGHDNTMLSEIGRFTSVDLKRPSVGHASVDLLLTAMKDKATEFRRVSLTPDLVHRGSTRALDEALGKTVLS